jgi:hypothetical protein
MAITPVRIVCVSYTLSAKSQGGNTLPPLPITPTPQYTNSYNCAFHPPSTDSVAPFT